MTHTYNREAENWYPTKLKWQGRKKSVGKDNEGELKDQWTGLCNIAVAECVGARFTLQSKNFNWIMQVSAYFADVSRWLGVWGMKEQDTLVIPDVCAWGSQPNQHATSHAIAFVGISFLWKTIGLTWVGRQTGVASNGIIHISNQNVFGLFHIGSAIICKEVTVESLCHDKHHARQLW